MQEEDGLTQKGPEKRKHVRKSFVTAIDYGANGGMHTDFTKDISESGLFIETHARLEVGQELTMTFQHPALKRPIKVMGEIVRTTLDGIGVTFRDLTEDHRQTLAAF